MHLQYKLRAALLVAQHRLASISPIKTYVTHFWF